MTPRAHSPLPPPAASPSLNSPSTPGGPHLGAGTGGPASPLSSPALGTGMTASPTRIEPEKGLVIPTDRPIDELEAKWLHKLGRLRVDREVVLPGYALYGIRPWFLSRTHWAHTIVTQTGKPSEHISCYVLVPEPDVPPGAREQELASAIQFLADETRSHPKKTEHGTLLVTSPVGYGQEITPIPSGDFRDSKPYMLLNTGLRRLGCGGRAVMGMESPFPAVRRKFYEYYRFPTPPGAPGLVHSRTASPTASPTQPASTAGASPTSGAASGGARQAAGAADTILHDPILATVVETVRLVQAALALWGLYMPGTEPVLDGMFCDGTKAAIFAWRREMGMEAESALKLEKETSGGCIDPKSLAALLSSVTSARYQLAALGVEKLPKDPFTSIRRFIAAWQGYLSSVGKSHMSWPYLCVPGLHVVSAHYVDERKGHPDPLKVHRLLLSGVASATSSLSANLKGGAPEDAPLRKREHHLRLGRHRDDAQHGAHHSPHAAGGGGRRDSAEPPDGASGLELIVPDAEIGAVAPPDAITTDLEAYTRGVLRSKEKEWDIMGARRIAALWSGHPAGSSMHLHGAGFRTRRTLEALGRRRPTVIDEGDDGEGGAMHAFRGMTAKTGQALRDGFGLVARRGTTYETSDSEGPGGAGQGSIRQLVRRRQSTVPMVIEPDVEEIDEQLGGLDRRDRSSHSPSPSHSGRHLDPWAAGSSAASAGLWARPPAASRSPSLHKRPTIVTSLSNDGSDGGSFVASLRAMSERRGRDGHGAGGAHADGHARADDDAARALRSGVTSAVPTSAPPHVWRPESSVPNSSSRGRGRRSFRGRLLSTASDGADVEIGADGMEWAVVSPLGTGRGQPSAHAPVLETRRRHSLQPHQAYDAYHVRPIVVIDLREREQQLAKRAKDMATLERSVFLATQTIIDALRERRETVERVEAEAAAAVRELRRAPELVDDDEPLSWAARKIEFYTSEDVNTGEVAWSLRELARWWERVRGGARERQKAAEDGRAAWWLGLGLGL